MDDVAGYTHDLASRQFRTPSNGDVPTDAVERAISSSALTPQLSAATTGIAGSAWPANWPALDTHIVTGWYAPGRYSVESRTTAINQYRTRLWQALAPLRSPRENWDSYGADPIDSETLERAMDFLSILALHIGAQHPRLYLVPTTNGGVALEWQSGPRELVVTFQPHSADLEIFRADPAIGLEEEFSWPGTVALPWMARETAR